MNCVNCGTSPKEWHEFCDIRAVCVDCAGRLTETMLAECCLRRLAEWENAIRILPDFIMDSNRTEGEMLQAVNEFRDEVKRYMKNG